MPQLDSGAFWGIAGIVAGIFLYYAGKRGALLQYKKFSTPLLTEKMNNSSGTNMSINGKPVNSLILTTIEFTNIGNKPIRSSDFASQKPLHINIKGNYYGHSVSVGNQDLVPSLDEKNMNIYFEGLQPTEFCSVKIYHDGTLTVSGNLTTGKMVEYRSKYKLFLFFAVIHGLVCTALGFVICFDALFSGHIAKDILGNPLGILIIVITLFVTPIISGNLIRKKQNI